MDKADKYLCGTCGGEIMDDTRICPHCDSQLSDSNLMLRLTKRDLQSLMAFIPVMFRSRSVANGLFRYMRNISRAYKITDGAYDISGQVENIIRKKI